MPTTQDILRELESLGTEQTRKTLRRHGGGDDVLGVKVEDLKKIQKRIKVDHQLALDLFATGVSDAMYLAALIVDPSKMKAADLSRWVKAAYWSMISDYAVAWVAAESPHGWKLGLKWIESPREMIASAGWCTLSSVISITPDENLDAAEIHELLQRCVETIHEQPNHVKYTMNGFVIAVGCYIPELTKEAVAAAKKIGKVSVELGDTACKVPAAADYIAKVQKVGRLGRKRKMARC